MLIHSIFQGIHFICQADNREGPTIQSFINCFSLPTSSSKSLLWIFKQYKAPAVNVPMLISPGKMKWGFKMWWASNGKDKNAQWRATSQRNPSQPLYSVIAGLLNIWSDSLCMDLSFTMLKESISVFHACSNSSHMQFLLHDLVALGGEANLHLAGFAECGSETWNDTCTEMCCLSMPMPCFTTKVLLDWGMTFMWHIYSSMRFSFTKCNTCLREEYELLFGKNSGENGESGSSLAMGNGAAKYKTKPVTCERAMTEPLISSLSLACCLFVPIKDFDLIWKAANTAYV